MSNRLPTRKRRGKTFRVILCDDHPSPGFGIDISIDRRTLHCWRGMTVAELLDSLELIREKVPGFSLALPVPDETEVRRG